MIVRRAFERSSLPEDGRRQLVTWLQAERSRNNLPQLQAEVARLKPGDPVPPSIQAMQQPIKIDEVRARGVGGNVIVKARVRFEGQPAQTRYFRMSHSVLGGWLVRGNSSELLWQLK